MSRLAGWFGIGGRPEVAANPSVDQLTKQREDLEDAMKWAELIMNDDMDTAWEHLQKQSSSFHQLASALIFFLRAILGFEKTVMTETSARLGNCEASASTDFAKAQKAGAAGTSSKIYPPGTEYELVRAESQLLGAVVGMLHENLVEAMKSFYKARKAFLALDGIINVESKFFADRVAPRLSTSTAQAGVPPATCGDTVGEFHADGPETSNDDLGNGASRDDTTSSSSDFVDAKEKSTGPQTPEDQAGRSTSETSPEQTLESLILDDMEPSETIRLQSKHVATDVSFFDNPVDAFIHSGANMCFGIILLMLTLVPPAFNRILSIIGFRGDRARGVAMLWRASAFPNINGAMAGMVLLGYYNAILGTVDILPDPRDFDEDAEVVGPPRERCDELLAGMRRRFPDSMLWRVEEARRHASDCQPEKAIEVLNVSQQSKMRQVAAIANFELSINALIVQNWPLMRDSFLRCIELNDWSPAIYYLMAGCASLELYRDAYHGGDETGARLHKAKAEGYIRKAPTVAGKKRFMARPLPLETFIQRKLGKWEARAKRMGVDLVDAIGTSPALEMCYVWNGQKRMGREQLERALDNLSWARCTVGEDKLRDIKSEKDEMAIWALDTAAVLKRLGRYREARDALQEHVLKHDAAVFKGDGKDDYVQPAATYEMAAIAWLECCHPPEPPGEIISKDNAATGTDEAVDARIDGYIHGAPLATTNSKLEATLNYRRNKLDECQEWLDKAKNWEAYTLDARIGLRVRSGLETLGWFRRKMRWESSTIAA